MISDQAISIAVRPEPHYPDDENRRLPQDDFETVSAWIRANRDLIVDYWDNKVDTNEFRLRVTKPPTDC